MVDVYNNNNPRLSRRIDSQNLEAKVTSVSHIMAILMVALENMFGPFGEFGSSN